MQFEDVLLVPTSQRNMPGAHWPDFESQFYPRLLRRGQPRCMPPAIPAGAPQVEESPVIFVSVYDNHFGHMVSETVPRLAQALAELPDDWPLVFTSNKPLGSLKPSAMFCAVMNWLDIPMERVRFCATPTVFRNLHIAAQAEHLDGPWPTPVAYLELLEARTQHKLPVGPPEGVTFVTRAALDVAKGYHAGERYLVACLEKLGVRVVCPEKLDLPEQMAIYAKSHHLVFSEGSALHGRQLFGRREHHISVLRRRQRSRLAKHQIRPRCQSFEYVSSFGGALHVIGANDKPIAFATSTLYCVESLIAHFEKLGVPLHRVWQQRLYEKERDEHVLRWIASMYHPKVAHWLQPRNEPEHILEQLSDLGLEHLTSRADKIMRT